ncbi:hypothetical protein PF005_g4334 [Phytophthora fragariae]|uniref:RxLR effector protein n=1 Tax=Phytophthora fragariae TaxID=53985 RepID=A0A6A4E7V8_9STRA|nr:hypothetical protein PF003_g15863 [Phytophthora fragariae]KAE8946513.1 hypothetical protein PF009_g3855 [Phytophthora fragariae]KAE9023908.1 hypothetical protein PF011_g3749 [Phytophthora fragariae]KAE9129839.1 hypothetical protein PF010_g4057 [Phytophthora fragariae]KAE9129937.1 hypothetical protein PF007_g4710 [Phytophthora fragariae]
MTVLAVAISVCASAAIVATADKRSLRALPSGMKSTFATTTFEQAMRASKTDCFTRNCAVIGPPSFTSTRRWRQRLNTCLK